MGICVLLAVGQPTPADGVTIQEEKELLWCCWVLLWLRENLVAKSGGYGVQGVFQHFWSFLVMPGDSTYCPVMHLLGLLVGRIKTTF